MNRAITECLEYFAQFQYAPTFTELHTFLKQKISSANLERELEILMRKGQLKRFKLSESGEYRYYTISKRKNTSTSGKDTLGEYSIRRLADKFQFSYFKFQIARRYISILALFPQIKLIGLSGSVAMMNAKEDDDIDLFVVTVKDRLWTGRFISLVLSQVMGKRRKYGDKKTKDKICLNLFFDEQDIAVPRKKHSEYVAHEVLQMKPVVVKGDIYYRYLDANKWVYDIFPNSMSKLKTQNSKLQLKNQNFIFDVLCSTLALSLSNVFHVLSRLFSIPCSFFESLLKQIQMKIINRHRTTEYISDTQLWFHPDNFEKKIRRSI